MSKHETIHQTDLERITPLARRKDEDVLTRWFSDELVVYDLARDQVHYLNQTAGTIWEQCDGHNTPAEMAQYLGTRFTLGSEQAEALVWLALHRLDQARLLEDRLVQPQSKQAFFQRRRVLKLLGRAVLLPVIVSAASPLAAQAQSVADCTCSVCAGWTGRNNVACRSLFSGNCFCAHSPSNCHSSGGTVVQQCS